MKNKILFSTLLLFTAITVKAQSGNYALASLPDSLRKKAAVIMQYESSVYEIDGIDKASLKVHQIYSVMNEEGRGSLFFSSYTNKYVALDDVEIKLTDVNGKTIEKYKKKDMKSTAIGEGLVEDGYMVYCALSTLAYPVTVEVKYEQRFKSTLAIPDYRYITPGEAVLESNYTARVPADMSLRYKAVNSAIQPEITEEGKYRVYKWNVKNLAPLQYEEGAVSGRSRYPHIKIVTDKFSHYGFEGDLSSWKNFGDWLKNLYEGLDVLPPARQQFFQSLVKNAADDREKVRLIYDYLQRNFRYVSIQLGIGGLRPFSAEFTDTKKYGDCKALSNYMKAALKTVGITSYVAIINAQYNELPADPGFPSDDFNHVILCVPGKNKDSIWLECTSSTASFAELGSFTENRNALLITEQGGVLVPTPESRSSTNILSTYTTVELDQDLSAIMETKFTTRGDFREMMDGLRKEKRDIQKGMLVTGFGFKQPDDFVINEVSSATMLKMSVQKLPEFVAGNKLFINPRRYRIWSGKLPKAENRKLDFYFHNPFEIYDTVALKLPTGFKTEELTRETELQCKYASYKSKSWYDESQRTVYSVASLILRKHKIPAADYSELKKFFDDYAKDDAQRIVLLKEAGLKAF